MPVSVAQQTIRALTFCPWLFHGILRLLPWSWIPTQAYFSIWLLSVAFVVKTSRTGLDKNRPADQPMSPDDWVQFAVIIFPMMYVAYGPVLPWYDYILIILFYLTLLVWSTWTEISFS